MGKKVAEMTPEQVEHQRQQAREYHQRNKEKVSERKRIKRMARYHKLMEIFGYACQDCGVECMYEGFFDFHHINPKEKDRSISQMLSSTSAEKLMAEVEKCILLCPNCHRLRHIKDGHYYNAKG